MFLPNKAEADISAEDAPALVAMGLLQLKFHAHKLSIDDALYVVFDPAVTDPLKFRANSLVETSRPTSEKFLAEQARRLDALVSSNARIEVGIDKLAAVTTNIDAAAQHLTERLDATAERLTKNTQDVADAVSNVERRIMTVAETAIKAVENTSEDAAVKASLKAGRMLTWRFAPVTIALSIVGALITNRLDTPETRAALFATFSPHQGRSPIPIKESDVPHEAIIPKEPRTRLQSARDAAP